MTPSPLINPSLAARAELSYVADNERDAEALCRQAIGQVTIRPRVPRELRDLAATLLSGTEVQSSELPKRLDGISVSAAEALRHLGGTDANHQDV